MALGKAKVNILANLKPLKRGLISAKAAIVGFMKRAGSVMKFGFTSAFKVINSGLRKIVRLAKLAAVALIGIGIASIKIASDVVETENLFKISMGSMADSAGKFAKDYSKSLNLFENDTRKSLGTFQLMLTSMGLTEKASFEMSKGLTKLVNDISSFRNQNPAEVFLKLTAGITGESEPLKRLGILVNETVIKNLALSDSTIKARLSTTKMERVIDSFGRKIAGASNATKKQGLVLTETEKIMLRYKAIVNATSLDTGDMARTLDDTANVFRQIWAQVKVTGNTIGKIFIPSVTKAGIAVREFFVNNQPKIEKWAKISLKAITAVVDKLKSYFELAKTGNFEAIFKDIGRIFGQLAKGLVSLFEKLKPVAVNLGNQIGQGFLEAIRGTKLGKFLGAAGKVLGAPSKAASGIQAAVNLPFEFQRRTNLSSLESEFERKRGQARGLAPGAERNEVVSELKRLNQRIQRIVEQGARF